ncbi:MAG: hypothetical protein EZS28_044481, partial [Streblomastix strix]
QTFEVQPIKYDFSSGKKGAK